MVKVIKISKGGDLQKGIKALKRIRTKIPEMSSELMLKWGKILERDVKNSARQAGIKAHTGELFNKGIEYRQKPRGRIGFLFIRDYGVKLDSMNPHYVSITRNRSRLMNWALQANNSTIQSKGRSVASGNRARQSIYVRPHPFIRRGYLRARKKLSPMLKQKVQTTIKDV